MQKWEYMWMYLAQDPQDKSKYVYFANGERIEAPNHGAALNVVGKDGWELVTVMITVQTFPQFFLKRPISD
jgi:hypothetical protein